MGKRSISSPHDRAVFAKMPKSLARRRQTFQTGLQVNQDGFNQQYSHQRNVSQKPGSQYQFLVGRYIDQATLHRAEELAKRWHVPPHHVLFAMGWLNHETYTRALAEYVGLGYAEHINLNDLELPQDPVLIKECYRAGFLRGHKNRYHGLFLSSVGHYPRSVSQLAQKLSRTAERITLVSLHKARRAIIARANAILTREAIFGLEAVLPGCSARQGITLLQGFCISMILGVLLGIAFMTPEISLLVLGIALSCCFLPIVLLRFFSCAYTYVALKKSKKTVSQASHPALHPARLPVYTVLVPIFREHTVLPDLIQALLRLDYPRAKLDIKLIFESCDTETLNCAKRLAVPDSFEFIIVPDSHPRTKPKALNYAMQFAKGDYIVIYDAEDQPEPDQLLKAIKTFRTTPKEVACLQAQLNFYNASENWLTKQFSIEYASLFNGLLPTLQFLKFPIPLGGTSNHFRMSALERVGRWDAFNVTEDADLGIRLYRAGYRCEMLDSVTYEEATCSLIAWTKQRTRWLKGWMQTYAVHMRSPLKLLRQLGVIGFFGFHVILGGMILSALIHPIFLATLIYLSVSVFMFGSEVPYITFLSDHTLGLISIFNITFGYMSVMLLSVIVLTRKRIQGLRRHIMTMWVYWILISIAAYRAIFQWIRAPFLWEKTTHGVTRLKPDYQIK